jgi:hypothetical protein
MTRDGNRMALPRPDEYRDTVGQRIHERSLIDADVRYPFRQWIAGQRNLPFRRCRAATSALEFCDNAGLTVNHRRSVAAFGAVTPKYGIGYLLLRQGQLPA